MSRTDLLLAGDIGGTKANLVLVDPAGDPRRPLYAERIPTADHPSLEALLDAFLAKAGHAATTACLGIPSPVIDGHVAPVNIHWQAQEQTVARHLGLRRVRFLNDLVATALGIPELSDNELVVLHAGAPRINGVKAIIAPGTGLGTGWLAHQGEHGTEWEAYPSEGGHAEFAPRGALQRRLLAHMATGDQQVIVESVCSGRGIANLWRFFGSEGLRDSPAVEAAAAAAADPTPVVMAAAHDLQANPRAAAAADEFVAILFQVAGNTALRWLATGGVYLAGGVSPKVLPWLRRPAALAAYLASPTLSRVLRETPLLVVLNEQTAVLGAFAGGRTL